MDMEHIYARLTGAGMFGAAVSAFGSFIAWLTADETHKLLANALMLCCLISAIIAIVAALVRLCITQHKNNKALQILMRKVNNLMLEIKIQN